MTSSARAATASALLALGVLLLASAGGTTGVKAAAGKVNKSCNDCHGAWLAGRFKR